MKVFYDKDCDLSLIKGKTVAIIGYGSQGHAHAQNLNDSGVKVVVGLRKGGASWDKVGKAGLTVKEVNDAVKEADVVMILLPDEQIAEVYKNNVEPNIKQGASLAFAHGFNVHYNQVVPRADLDVWMVAPKAPGHTVRNTYPQGGGVPHLVALITGPVVIFDHLRRTLTIVVPCATGAGVDIDAEYRASVAVMEDLKERLAGPVPATPAPAPELGPVYSNMPRVTFETAVERAREYIHAGDVFQVVPSQRFSASMNLDPFSVYRALRTVNPSPYMYFLEADGVTLVGSSPEPMVQLLGGRVISRPTPRSGPNT